MRAFLAALLLVAVLVHSSQAQQTAWQWLQANAATYSTYLASINVLLGSSNPATVIAGETIVAILNGTAPSPAPSTITLFLPSNAAATSNLNLAQLQLSIVAAYDGQNVAVFYNTSSTTDGAILTTLYVEPLLGASPTGLPVPAGTPGQQAIKLGKSGSTYTVLASPDVPPVTISTADVVVSNGAIQIYTTGNVLTPAGNAQTVLTNLQSPYKNFFTSIIAAIGASQNGWTTLNNLTSPLVTGSIGYTFLLPTTDGLGTLSAGAGPGIAGYLTTAAGGAEGQTDLINIFSYHIILSPGFAVGYSYALEYALSNSQGGVKSFNTGFYVGTTAQTIQLSLTSTGLNATSFATFTAPVQIGGSDITTGATVPIDLIIGNGVAHGLQGILLPPAVQLLLPKVILGGGFSSLSGYLSSTGLTAALNNASITYTILAPTNAALTAFVAKYPTLASNITVLTQILLLHVITGLKATSVGKVGPLPAATYTTLYGSSATISVSAASNLVQSVTISGGGTSASLDVTATSLAQNGYVYSINTVLVPAALIPSVATTTPSPSPTSNASPVSMSVVGVIAAIVVAFAFRA